jgi:SAM-dependent methyltransferase
VSELARSFGDVAEAYERGRPRYSPEVIATIARHAGGGPRLLDVGAGTGRLAGPLREAGYDVVAVEPLDGMRAILTRAIGPERALAGSAEALPLPHASVDGVVCADAWHWFDGPRAADEVARVMRPGGGAVVCISLMSWLEEPERAPAWWQDVEAVLTPIFRAANHPSEDQDWRPKGLADHPAFAPIAVSHEPFVHRYPDRHALLAHLLSNSWVSSLPLERRVDVMAQLEDVLVRHRIDGVDAPYRAELWVTRRRRAPAPPVGPPAAAS